MTTVEKDTELNRMLITSVTDKLSNKAASYLATKAELEAGVLEMAQDAYSVLFAAFPWVEAITWTQSSGEYNDSGYDGFTISNYGVRPVVGYKYNYETWEGNGPKTVEATYGIDAEGNPVEEDDFLDEYYIKDTEFNEYFDNISEFHSAFADVLERNYGDSTRVTVTATGIETEHYSSS